MKNVGNNMQNELNQTNITADARENTKGFNVCNIESFYFEKF